MRPLIICFGLKKNVCRRHLTTYHRILLSHPFLRSWCSFKQAFLDSLVCYGLSLQASYLSTSLYAGHSFQSLTDLSPLFYGAHLLLASCTPINRGWEKVIVWLILMISRNEKREAGLGKSGAGTTQSHEQRVMNVSYTLNIQTSRY